ncbi:transglutaminase-like domain-containing protein [Carboxylicivirga sp. RSCT41]|uniref:transglutaminase-like domain-containing protein n=1 Tax=Carboxylicivirga agarovorans TaxID=3417570 RepID=UPI003D337B70
MVLKNYSWIALLLILAVQVRAKDNEDKGAEYYKAKYKGYSAFYHSREETLHLTLKGGSPEFINSSSSSLYVLSDHAKGLAGNREYFSSKYQLESLKGYTLIPSGRGYKKLEAPEYTKSSVIGSGIFFDDNIAYSFNFPAVCQGAQLVTEASASVDDVYFPFRFYFGSHLPVESSSFTVVVPKGTRLKYRLMGMDEDKVSFSKTTKRNNDVYTWEAADMRAYQDDFLSPNWLYYMPHIVVQLAGYQLGDAYHPVLDNTDQLYDWAFSKIKDIHDQQSESISFIADSVAAGVDSEREKVRRVFKWVQNNIKYVAIEDGDNGFVPRPASKVLQRRYGDCKDKTSIMVAMLKSLDIDASFGWIGTRSVPYRYTDIPSLLVDNHMIAVWWDKDTPHFLDGTTRFHSLEDVPAALQGKECMVERGPENYRIVRVPVDKPEVNSLVDTIKVQLDGDVIRGEITSIYSGERKADLHRKYSRVKKEKYKNAMANSRLWASNKFLVDSISISDLANVDAPFIANYSFHLSDYITEQSKRKYINLNFERGFSRLKIKKDRDIPIEAEMASQQSVITILEVPEGYDISFLPKDIEYNDPKFSFSSRYRKEKGQVILETSYSINFLILEGEEISRFRKMISTIKHASMQSIILTQI